MYSAATREYGKMSTEQNVLEDMGKHLHDIEDVNSQYSSTYTGFRHGYYLHQQASHRL